MEKIKVLFICHGNICRSPMAEFIFKDMVSKQGLSDRFYIASAATSTEEIWNGIGNPVYPPAREELAKHGIDCKGKRAVQLTKADYDKYDYILGMDHWNLKNMLRILALCLAKRVNFGGIFLLVILLIYSRMFTISLMRDTERFVMNLLVCLESKIL